MYLKKMIKIKRNIFLEMKYKIKYLEYYFMVIKSKGKEVDINKKDQIKIKQFIFQNRYESLTQVSNCFNKRSIKIEESKLHELKEFSSYSDDLKKLTM